MLQKAAPFSEQTSTNFSRVNGAMLPYKVLGVFIIIVQASPNHKSEEQILCTYSLILLCFDYEKEHKVEARSSEACLV